MINPGNIFQQISDSGKKEVFIPLLERAGFRLEQIVSNGQASEPGFWYDQEKDEWVLLVRGEAVLEFEQERATMKAGDYLLIPARKKHRVASCSQDAIWLALHLNE
jgi:cupin 2 domain-containing protein